MATKPAAKTPLKTVPTGADSEAPAAKKKSKMMIIVPVLLVVLLAGGGGAWFYLHRAKPVDPAAAAEPAAQKPPVFMTLEPFTVNLQGGEHFLQIGLVLQVANDETSEALKAYLPQIRNRLLLLLSSQTPESLETTDAKKKLAEAILTETRQPLAPATAEGVQSVLFASMVVQ